MRDWGGTGGGGAGHTGLGRTIAVSTPLQRGGAGKKRHSTEEHAEIRVKQVKRQDETGAAFFSARPPSYPSFRVANLINMKNTKNIVSEK